MSKSRGKRSRSPRPKAAGAEALAPQALAFESGTEPAGGPDTASSLAAVAVSGTPGSDPSAVQPLVPGEPVALPARSRHDPANRRRPRRRRSGGRLPAVVNPIDIPDDAAGRVEFVVVRGLDDRDEPESSAPAESPSRPTLTIASGWLAVAIVATIILIAFASGMLLSR